MENKIINYINQTPENTNPSVLATLLGELKVPKPLTFDYMPEGYPKKAVQTTTLMEEQELAFAPTGGTGLHLAALTEALEIIEGQTYTVSWDGTKYDCICRRYADGDSILGNKSFTGAGDDTGEPFLYISSERAFATLDTSASHTISVKKIEETITPMSEEFLPNTTTGGVTTLHINVTALNTETMEATFTADKTPAEMKQAAVNGPIWCVVTFAAGVMSEKAVSIGVPPAWYIGGQAFGVSIDPEHVNTSGENKERYFVMQNSSDSWILDLSLL